MISIQEIAAENKEYIPTIVHLHSIAFPSFFLTQLGTPFLKALYTGYLEDEKSGILIAKKDNVVVGVLAYSMDYSQFYKNLIKKYLFRFMLCSFCAAINHPTYIKRLFRAFKKSESVQKPQKYVELSSICVNPQFEGYGIGSALIRSLINKVDFNQYEFINLETYAENNDAVNAFYRKNNFVLARQIITNEGQLMNEYRYRPGNKTYS